jgi:hypothetical protein
MLKSLIFTSSFIFLFSAFAQDEIETDKIDLEDEESQLLNNNLDMTVEVEIKNELLHAKKKKKKTEGEILEELTKLREKNVNELLDYRVRNNKAKYSNSAVEALKIQIEDIARSPIKLVRLIRGTHLIDLQTNKRVYITKDINVKIHTLADYDKYNYIINKEGEIKYRVANKRVIDISEITHLYDKPEYFTESKPRVKSKRDDTEFNYTLGLNAGIGLSNPNYTHNLLLDTTGYATQNRFEAMAITNLNTLFNVGFIGAYEFQTGKLDDVLASYQAQTFSFGPVLKTLPSENNYQFTLASRLSIDSTLTEFRDGNSRTHKLSEINIVTGIEKLLKTNLLGTFSLGMNYQRKWIRAKASTVSFDLNSADNFDDSIVFYIGNQTDFRW